MRFDALASERTPPATGTACPGTQRERPAACEALGRWRWALLTCGAGLALLALAACDGQRAGWAAIDQMIRADHPNAASISTDSLAARLNRDASSGRPPVLLDVRTPEEYAVSHLQNAQRVDPDAEVEAGGANLPALGALSLDAPIVVYCSVGYRSSALAERLQAAGFTNVSNLDGSIFKWANEGRPVYRGDERVREVHPYNRVWGRLLEDSLRAYAPSGQGE